MNRLILASNNAKKVKELKEICKHLPLQIVSLDEIGFLDEIIEDGTTYEQNALIKVNAIRQLYPNDFIIGDDSGLEVDALNGEPGIYSARYEKTTELRIEKLLENMKGQTNRRARFITLIALYIPNQGVSYHKGICEGEITDSPKGNNGFGYDPIFYCNDLKSVMALVSPQEKASVSHRSKALKSAIAKINEYYE